MVDAPHPHESNSPESENNELNELQRKAIRTALGSERLEDFEKAFSVSKLLSETHKNIRDAYNQSRILRFEGLKSWAAILVPFLSIVTLAVTIGMQYAQLSATREANADLQWRETVKNVLSQLKGGTIAPTAIGRATTSADPFLAMALLKPYLSDERYGKDATELALLVLSRVNSSEVFQDYFISSNIQASWGNLGSIMSVDRSLWTQQFELDKSLEGVPEDKHATDPRAGLINTLLGDISFIGDRVAELLRTQRPRSSGRLNFKRAFFFNSDFSNTDLTTADLTDSRIENVRLEGADLRNILYSPGTNLVDSHWWDAKQISEPFLRYLMNSYYPYYPGAHFEYANAPPSRDEYAEKIRKLCESAGVTCKPEDIKYGKPWVPESKP